MQMSSDLELHNLIIAVREHDDEAFAALIKRYTPLINKVIFDFCGAGIRVDEAFAEACVGLHRAVLSYDLSNEDVTFGLYAKICIIRRLRDLVGRMSGAKNPIIEECDVDLIATSEVIEAGIVGRETVHRSIARAKEILSEYEYKVFLLYLKGYTTADIAKELSKTPKSVDNAKARMMRHLREKSDSFPIFD